MAQGDRYPTMYANASQQQLTALFSAEQWSSLSFSQRMAACQEVENRYAAEHNVEPCLVTHRQLEGPEYGRQNGSTIWMNTSLVRDGQFVTHYVGPNGEKCEARTNALAPGWNTLDTVYHEGTHGVQESQGRMPYTYVDPNFDGDLYRIQGVEKEAYAVGQARTLQALSDYEKAAGKLDASRNDYLTSVKNDSFRAALADAAYRYNDPDIERTLQSVIEDREKGVIPANPSKSYQAVDSLLDHQYASYLQNGQIRQDGQTAQDGQNGQTAQSGPNFTAQNTGQTGQNAAAQTEDPSAETQSEDPSAQSEAEMGEDADGRSAFGEETPGEDLSEGGEYDGADDGRTAFGEQAPAEDPSVGGEYGGAVDDGREAFGGQTSYDGPSTGSEYGGTVDDGRGAFDDHSQGGDSGASHDSGADLSSDGGDMSMDD